MATDSRDTDDRDTYDREPDDREPDDREPDDRDLARAVRSAMENADLEAFLSLCAEDVHWGAPGDTHGGCQNRNQVRSWYEAAFGRGVRATVMEVVVVPGGLVVGLEVSGSPAADSAQGGAVERWQLLTIRHARITNICGFDHRDEALAWAGVNA